MKYTRKEKGKRGYHVIADEKRDGRVKLTADQKSDIIKEYANSSLKELALKYRVNIRTIDFIVHPEKLERNRQLLKDRGGNKYNAEENKSRIQKYREHKRELITFLKNDTMQDILKALQRGHLVEIISLKDNTKLGAVTILKNNFDSQEIECMDRVIPYSEIKSLIFRTK